VKIALESNFNGVKVFEIDADPSLFEVIAEDGTIIYSGKDEYEKSKNMGDKFPSSTVIVERMKNFLKINI